MTKSSKAQNIDCATCDNNIPCVNPFKGAMAACPNYAVNGKYLGANLASFAKTPKSPKAIKPKRSKPSIQSVNNQIFGAIGSLAAANGIPVLSGPTPKSIKTPKTAKTPKSSTPRTTAKSGKKQAAPSLDIKEDHSKDCVTCGNGELASKCFSCGGNVCFRCGRGSKPLIYCEACYTKLPGYLKPVIQMLSSVAVAQGVEYVKRALTTESCFTIFSENSNEVNLYYHLSLDDAKAFIISKTVEDPEIMLFLCVAYGQKIDIT